MLLRFLDNCLEVWTLMRYITSSQPDLAKGANHMSGQNEAETLDTGETASDSNGGAQTEKEGTGQPRQRSTIGFPYSDLSDAIQLAQAIHSHVGHGYCDDNQLAAWVDQSPKSSGFRVQISAARMFGVIETDSGGSHQLTPLGIQIVDVDQAREAKVCAFLNVPLYKAAYEKYKGGTLPPPAALELDFVRLGVAEKQKDKARIEFYKSAELAGFFEHGKAKLVQPGIVSRNAGANGIADGKEDNTCGGGTGGGTGGGGNTLNLDPLLMALLEKIPTKPEEWPEAKRLRWFRTFAMNVSQVYDEDEAPIELEIKVLGKQ